jgi:hypothetical protein
MTGTRVFPLYHGVQRLSALPAIYRVLVIFHRTQVVKLVSLVFHTKIKVFHGHTIKAHGGVEV